MYILYYSTEYTHYFFKIVVLMFSVYVPTTKSDECHSVNPKHILH